MTHIAVPCPEEHVAEFTAGLMRLVLGSSGWDTSSVGDFVAGLDAPSRALVVSVAQVSVDYGRLPYAQAAAHLGVDVGQVLHIVTDVNDRCRRASVPPLLITETLTTTSASGDQVAAPVIVILRPVAQSIVGSPRLPDESITNL